LLQSHKALLRIKIVAKGDTSNTALPIRSTRNRSWMMNRDLENLERLCRKMQTRYGAEDAMVQQLMEELAAKKTQRPQTQHWTANYQRSTAARPRADSLGR
jgi:hypothetical protein